MTSDTDHSSGELRARTRPSLKCTRVPDGPRQKYGPGFVPIVVVEGDDPMEDLGWFPHRYFVGYCTCWHDRDTHELDGCGVKDHYVTGPTRHEPTMCPCTARWVVDDEPIAACACRTCQPLQVLCPNCKAVPPDPDGGPLCKGCRRSLPVVTVGERLPSRLQVEDGPANVRWLRRYLGAAPAFGWMFLRGSQVVRVTCANQEGYIRPSHDHEDNGPATVAPLTGEVLSTKLSDILHVWQETLSGSQVPTFMPVNDCARALAMPEELTRLRVLRGITHTPIPRSTGGMITEPGYDHESGVLLHPIDRLPDVPEQVDTRRVAEATGYVRGLLADFAWVGEHSEANYVGALITPFLRLVAPPPYKLIAIDAHQRGSGKTLLAEVARIIHGGTLRSWPSSDEELAKQVTSILTRTTAPVCVIDNIRGLIRSPKLEALLTSATWTDRVLGTSNDTTVGNDRLWVATANNLAAGGDLDRRTVWVRIDPGLERPEDRPSGSFAIPDLISHVRRNRTRIIGELLTMIAWWDAQGRPLGEQATADSYGLWVATVRGILGACGVPGTFDHAESRKEDLDPDAVQAGEFLTALADVFGTGAPWTVRDVTDAMDKDRYWGNDHGRGLVETLPDAARGRHWRPDLPSGELRRSLGYWIRNRTGQWFDGRAVRKVSDTKVGARYQIVRRFPGAAPSADGGDGATTDGDGG